MNFSQRLFEVLIYCINLYLLGPKPISFLRSCDSAHVICLPSRSDTVKAMEIKVEGFVALCLSGAHGMATSS